MKQIAYLIITLIIMMPLSGCLDSANNGEDGTNGEQGETALRSSRPRWRKRF